MKYFFCCLLLFCCSLANAQEKDSSNWIITTPEKVTGKSAVQQQIAVADSGKPARRKIIPRVATIRSAILPGWGQMYNRSYWKLPIVYGALGTTTYIFLDNIKTYRLYRDGYRILADTDPNNDNQLPDELEIFRNQKETLRYGRDQFRRYIDYSVLFFVFFWGLNVVDATVDAHLSSWDISRDLSLHLKPGYSPLAQTNGISLVLSIGKNPSKNVISLR